MQYFVFWLGIILTLSFLALFFKRKIYFKYNKYVCAVTLAAAVAIILEVFTFNYNFYEYPEKFQRIINVNTVTSQTAVIEEKGTPKAGDSMMACSVSKESNASENIYRVELTNVNFKLNNLDIALISNDRAVKCQLYYTDDANSGYARANDQTMIVSGVKSTSHIKPDFAGENHNLKIELVADGGKEISSIQIKLNYPLGFAFNIFRVLFVFALCFICTVIYITKGSGQLCFDKKSIKQLVVIMAFVAVEIAFTICISVAGNMKFADNGKYSGIDFYEGQDPYHELTLAITQGKVDLNNLNPETMAQEQDGIAKLGQLENPYDWSRREGITYKWDRAFYNGKYYCYFGIVPAVFAYVPYYLITGHMLNTKILTLLLVVISQMLMAALVYGIAGQFKKRLNLWMVIGAIAGFINVSMVIYCINGSKFYEIASMAALVCALAGLNFIIRAFENKKYTSLSLGAGALFMALSVGCRPNYVIVSFVGTALMLNGLAKNGGYVKKEGYRAAAYIKGVLSKENICNIAAVAIPYIIVAAGLMYYNYIRFGSVTEFGARYQLTVYDTGYYSAADFGKIPLMFARCFFMFPQISSVFPYVNAVSESSNYVGYYYGMSYMGILANPIMWSVVLLGWSLRRGIKDMGHRAFVTASIAAAVIMCYITTTMGGTSLRYSVDFAWLFFIPVIYIMFDMYDRGRRKGITKYILILLSLLVLATVVINTLMCISPSWSSLSEMVPEIFYRIEEMIVFWK